MGGVSPYEGRVEICEDLEWGTVCDDLWGSADSRVACRQLGYSHSTLSGKYDIFMCCIDYYYDYDLTLQSYK